MVAGGIRGSKSVSAAMEAVVWTPHSELVWLGADSYDLTRIEFEYTAEALLSLDWTTPGLVNMPDNRYQPCSLRTRWGTLVETRTLHDVNTFVARAPDFIAICEPGLAQEASLTRARERLSTRRGRLYLPGTFEEVRYQWMEDYWRRWVRWPNEDNAKSFTVPSWVNRVIFPLGKYDPEIAALRRACRDLNEFLRRVVGVPSQIPDIIMSDSYKVQHHVGNVEWVRKDSYGNILPVQVAIDPGHSSGHYVVLTIQIIDGVIRVVDEIDAIGETHGTVIQTATFRDWMPFVLGGTIDPYAADSEIFGAVSPKAEWWQQAKVNLTLAPRLHVEELIKLIKSFLRDPATGKPRLVISPRCTRLLWEMEHWRRKKSTDGQGIPGKNNCDAIKALGYFLTEHLHRVAAGGALQPVVSSPRYG